MPTPQSAPSPQVLASIAARARPLHEQFAPALDAGRRNRWRAASARGVEADFVRRLSQLAEPVAGPTTAIPGWLEILQDAAGRCSAPTDSGDVPIAVHELDPLLAPLLDEAQAQLAKRSPPAPCIAGAVANALRDGLRRDLSRLSAPCIDNQFAAYRNQAGSEAPADLWSRFEREALASGLFALWDAYPALARLVGVRLLNWVDRNTELLERFAADRVALTEFLAVPGEPRLEAVEFAGSDPHNGHAVVTVCTVSGTRVVYKPKDLSAEVFLSELVRWSNRIGMDVGLATDVLARDRYGWVGFIEQAPVDDEGAQRFYTRIGRLAALLFALGGNDAHAENVVACGDAPVVIDAETVLQPTLPAEDGRPAVEWVLDGLLLPRWLHIAGTAVDLSATGAPGTAWRRTELRWQNYGGPQMELARVVVEVGDFPSALRSATGDLYRPEHFAQEILSGFRQGWQLLAGHVSDFVGPGGWLDHLSDVRVRVLVRMTRTYARLLDSGLNPALLRSGVERSIHLDHVARSAFDRDVAEPWLGLAEAERRMLEDGDVPFFSVRADESALHFTDTATLIRFVESSLARARRRLAGLDEHALELQSDVVRASLAIAPVDCRAKAFESTSGDQPATNGDVATAAAVVAARMSAQLTKFGGPAAPLGLVAASPSQWAIDVPGPGLYDGRIGVAVALASGAAALDDYQLAGLAREVAEPVLEDAVGRPRRLVLHYGIGGQDGVGGVLLGFALSERITQAGDHGLEVAFHSLAAAVAEDDLDGANPLDLLTGLPGLMAGLAAGASLGWGTGALMGRVTRRVMDATATHLTTVQSGTTLPNNGFAHGDSGLAALLCGVARLDAGASEEALALTSALVSAESARFDAELGGWRDLRPGADPGTQGPGWCNGLPGIALSRALIADHGFDEIAVDLRRAREGLSTDRARKDTLCCGRAGRVAALQTIAANSASEVDVRTQYRGAFDEAAGALASAALGGGLRLGAPASPIAPLGLFQGLGGVLYALAKASCPTLPAVLAWGTDLC